MPKMKRAKIVKLSLDELAGVDAGAQAKAGAVILKRRDERSAPVATTKRAAITTAVLGHTHLLHGIDDMQSGCTSSERTSEPGVSSDSYHSYHSHPWVRTDDGSIVLGEAAGHTHDIAIAAASLVKTSTAKSTHPAPGANVAAHAEKNMPNTPDTEKQIAELTKRAERAERLATLTDAQKAHLATLSGADADAFLAKSAAERDAIVTEIEKRNEVVYTCGDGTEIRKSDGAIALKLAKQADEALKVANVEKAARELTELTKRANETLGNLAGDDGAHVALLKAAESIPDEAKRTAAIATLKAANAAMAAAGKAKGVNPGSDPEPAADKTAALAALEKGLVTFAKAQNITAVWTEGLAAFVQTDEGAALKRAYDAAK